MDFWVISVCMRVVLHIYYRYFKFFAFYHVIFHLELYLSYSKSYSQTGDLVFMNNYNSSVICFMLPTLTTSLVFSSYSVSWFQLSFWLWESTHHKSTNFLLPFPLMSFPVLPRELTFGRYIKCSVASSPWSPLLPFILSHPLAQPQCCLNLGVCLPYACS